MELIEKAIAKGIHPSQIAFSSFTRAASSEAADRAITRFVEYEPEDFPYFRTCHSIAYRLLGLNREQVFSGKWLLKFAKTFSYKMTVSFDHGDPLDSHEMVLNEDADYFEFFCNYWASVYFLKDFDAALRHFLNTTSSLPGTFTTARLREYIQRRYAFKLEHGLFDFGDMLLLVISNGLRPDIKLAIWDEAQDNSPLMFKVQQFWSADENYWIADPDQAIYTWFGADPNLFLDIKSDDDIVLRQSYRCPKSHHKLSQWLIQKNKSRYHDASFLPSNTEGWITHSGHVNLQAWHDLISGDKRVFLINRTNLLVSQQYDELMHYGIPFMTNRGKQSPLQHGAAKTISTFTTLYHGGYVTAADLFSAIDRFLFRPYLVWGAKADMKRLAPDTRIYTKDLFNYGFTRDFLEPFLDGNERDFISALKIPEEEKAYFTKVIKQFGVEVLKKEPSVFLSTIHGVKGKECDITVLNTQLTRRVEEGYSNDPESENRVFYVALTRAKQGLIILEPGDSRLFRLGGGDSGAGRESKWVSGNPREGDHSVS